MSWRYRAGLVFWWLILSALAVAIAWALYVIVSEMAAQ